MPVGLQSPLHSPKLMDLRRPVAAGWLAATPGWDYRDGAHHSHRCPQLPPTYAGTEISAQNNENLMGERRDRKGMETLFIFSDNEIANFQQSYSGKSFCKLL